MTYFRLVNHLHPAIIPLAGLPQSQESAQNAGWEDGLATHSHAVANTPCPPLLPVSASPSAGITKPLGGHYNWSPDPLEIVFLWVVAPIFPPSRETFCAIPPHSLGLASTTPHQPLLHHIHLLHTSHLIAQTTSNHSLGLLRPQHIQLHATRAKERTLEWINVELAWIDCKI